ncbi:hypothetical protein N0V88_000851 [Collariella sp. IMI 366227]|nr:hypothetical protein N0V88_000851 [Collariella sp. IMI 366227]
MRFQISLLLLAAYASTGEAIIMMWVRSKCNDYACVNSDADFHMDPAPDWAIRKINAEHGCHHTKEELTFWNLRLEVICMDWQNQRAHVITKQEGAKRCLALKDWDKPWGGSPKCGKYDQPCYDNYWEEVECTWPVPDW